MIWIWCHEYITYQETVKSFEKLTWGFILGPGIPKAAIASMPGPPREPRGTPPICKTQEIAGWVKIMNKFNSVSEAETEKCSQMALEWVWGEARRLATSLRRRWLEPSATALWTHQGSLLWVGDRDTFAPLRPSRKTDPEAFRIQSDFIYFFFPLTSRLDFLRAFFFF